MTRLRTRFSFVTCSLGLAAAIAFSSSCHKSDAPLPPIPAHANLPQTFDQALNAAEESVRASANDPAAWRRLAQLYQANRFSKEARACFDAIKSLPGGLNAQDHYYLAHLALDDGDLDAAQAELREVVKRDPRYLPARVALADALFKSGQSDEAAKEYAAVIAANPNHLTATIGLARIELQRGENDSATARLEKIIATHPETTLGADLLAHELSRRGEAERAAALTKGAREKHEPVPPDPWMDALLKDIFDGQALALRCEEYVMAGQIEVAAPLLDRVELLEPKSWIPHVLRGWSYGRAGKFNEGALEYSKALEVGGDPDKICPLITGLLVEGGKLQDAAELAAAFHKKQPDSVSILIAYTDVVARLGDEKTARVILPELLAREPYLYLQNMNYAKLLWTAGEKDAAIPYLQRVANVYPKDVASRGLIAEYYLGKSDPLSAIPPLEQALPYVPADTPARARLTEMLLQAYAQRSDALVQKGQLAEAAACYEKSLALNPANLAAEAALANCYVELKQFKKAAAVLGTMAAHDPQNPTILLSLGDVLFQDGSAEQAREQWKHALALVAPGDAELRDAIKARIDGNVPADLAK